MSLRHGLMRMVPICASLSMACAGRPGDAGEGDDAGMSGTSSAGETDDGETSQGDGSGEDRGGDAGETEGSCDPLSAEVPGEPVVTIVLENHGADTIYVDGARGMGRVWCLGTILPFVVERVETAEVMRPEAGWCSSLCGSVGDWYFCDGGACPPECPEHPGPIRIDPGGSYTIDWTAVVYRNIEVAEHCVSCDEPMTLTCQLPERLEEDIEYAFGAWAGSEPECTDCDCEPDADGSCVLGALDAGIVGPLVAATAVTTGRPETLSIVFE